MSIQLFHKKLLDNKKKLSVQKCCCGQSASLFAHSLFVATTTTNAAQKKNILKFIAIFQIFFDLGYVTLFRQLTIQT